MTKALTVQNLCKTYQGGFSALKNVSFEVEPGDFLAMLGPNGAGKSTTIGIITSLINKTSGQVEIFGHDIDRDFATAKTYLGVVPQEFNFNQFEKVGDIVRTQAGYYGIPKQLAAERTEKYLRLLNLWEKRNEASRMLSGGMKRRLMIARALVHEPKLLILDEPTAGVDIELRRSMWEFLEQLNKDGTTIILTTHYLEEAERLCRNIAIINHGEIIEFCPMKTFLARMDTQTYIVELAKPIAQLPELDFAGAQLLNDQSMEVEIPRTISLNVLFSKLDQCGIQVQDIRPKTNRLEELFVSMVEGR